MSRMFRLGLGFLALVPSLAHAAYLDIPGNDSTLSGIGVISGWKCEATAITVVIDDGAPIPMLYGSERGDTREVCGDTNNGFLAIFNYALLDDGEHTAVAYDDEAEFARSTFEVGTLGEEFVTGASAEVRVENFPSPGESTLLVWNQSSQHFEVVPEISGLAPVDRAAFNRLVVGKRLVNTADSRHYIDIPSAGRFIEYLLGEWYPGSYRYSNTGPDTGTFTQNYDDGDVCTSQVTFTSPTTASVTYTCDDGDRGGSNLRITDIPSSGGGTGSQLTRYTVGQTVPDIPTSGFWFPDVINTGAGASYEYMSGHVTLRWNTNNPAAGIEYNGKRYTCEDTSGCEVVDAVVTQGRIRVSAVDN